MNWEMPNVIPELFFSLGFIFHACAFGITWLMLNTGFVFEANPLTAIFVSNGILPSLLFFIGIWIILNVIYRKGITKYSPNISRTKLICTIILMGIFLLDFGNNFIIMHNYINTGGIIVL